MIKYFLILWFLGVLLTPFTEGIACYRHGICATKEYCVVDSNKHQCANSDTFCFKTDLPLGVAERGCAESFTCNASAPIYLRYCCNTDYCNNAISFNPTSRSIFLFVSTIISYIMIFF